MVLLAVCLIVVGLAVGLLGFKLFRALLPIAGLVMGAVIGFSGIQNVFGTGVVSTTIAVLAACAFGLVLAVLSYAFFEIALVVFLGLVMSSLFALLGVVLGLSANGFIVGLLSLAGFIVGVLWARSSTLLPERLVILVTSFIGVGYVLAGVFLLSGGVSFDELASKGIISAVADNVDQSFLWLFVWIAGAMLFGYAQMSTLLLNLFPEALAYSQSKK